MVPAKCSHHLFAYLWFGGNGWNKKMHSSRLLNLQFSILWCGPRSILWILSSWSPGFYVILDLWGHLKRLIIQVQFLFFQFFGNFSPYPTKSNLRLLSFFVVLLKSSLVFCGSSKMISFHMTITQPAKLEMDLWLRRPRAENRMEDGCYQVSYM